MEKVLITFALLFLAAPAFAQTSAPSSGGEVRTEAEKVDAAFKKDMKKVKKDVNSEVCSSGEETCKVPTKKAPKKKLQKSAPAVSPNAIENKDQAD